VRKTKTGVTNGDTGGQWPGRRRRGRGKTWVRSRANAWKALGRRGAREWGGRRACGAAQHRLGKGIAEARKPKWKD